MLWNTIPKPFPMLVVQSSHDKELKEKKKSFLYRNLTASHHGGIFTDLYVLHIVFPLCFCAPLCPYQGALVFPLADPEGVRLPQWKSAGLLTALRAPSLVCGPLSRDGALPGGRWVCNWCRGKGDGIGGPGQRSVGAGTHSLS